jgi:hypothetical protein
MASEIFLLGGGAGLSSALSVAALAVSGYAAWRASQQTSHLQRQADAAIGDLLPNFSLQPLAGGTETAAPVDNFVLHVDNHNRRPISIGKLTIEEPKKTGLMAYLVEGLRETLLGGSDRRHNEVAPSLLVPGTRPGAQSVSGVTLKLVLAAARPSRSGKPRDIKVAVRVDYEILSATPEQNSEFVQARIKAPSPPQRRAPAG